MFFSVAFARSSAISFSALALSTRFFLSCSASACSFWANSMRSWVALFTPKMAVVSLPNCSTSHTTTLPRPWNTFVTASPMAWRGAIAWVRPFVFSSLVLRESIIFCNTLARTPRMATAGVALIAFNPAVAPFNPPTILAAPPPILERLSVRWSTAPM